MIFRNSNSTLEIPIALTDMNTEYIEIFTSSFQCLSECRVLIHNQKWEEAMILCHKFLHEFPISHAIEDKGNTSYANFRKMASAMLSNGHNYDSVINLLNIKLDMTEFTKTFFHTIDKKGVHLPKPVITNEEVVFVYSFCTGFYSMILGYFSN